nr:MAG TPA: hypothetical protein [Caudoviricetes sp.]
MTKIHCQGNIMVQIRDLSHLKLGHSGLFHT